MTDTAVNYGNSLYELSAEENITGLIYRDIEAVAGLLSENPEYIRLLSEPSISKEERLKLIDEAFRGRVHQYSLNFMKLLCEERLLSEFSGCYRQFRHRYNEDHNITEAVVTIAYELSREQRDALRKKLEELSGKEVRLIEKVDKRFIAGIRVEIDGKQFDQTVAGRLNAMNKRISDIIV